MYHRCEISHYSVHIYKCKNHSFSNKREVNRWQIMKTGNLTTLLCISYNAIGEYGYNEHKDQYLTVRVRGANWGD